MGLGIVRQKVIFKKGHEPSCADSETKNMIEADIDIIVPEDFHPDNPQTYPWAKISRTSPSFSEVGIAISPEVCDNLIANYHDGILPTIKLRINDPKSHTVFEMVVPMTKSLDTVLEAPEVTMHMTRFSVFENLDNMNLWALGPNDQIISESCHIGVFVDISILIGEMEMPDGSTMRQGMMILGSKTLKYDNHFDPDL